MSDPYHKMPEGWPKGKSLLLIRHAKSSWDSPSMRDFDRTLNERGHKDAPAMAKRLLDHRINIDLFVSSTAMRALTTAEYFLKAYGAKATQFSLYEDLYHPEIENFYRVISLQKDKVQSMAIFSHNPGITEMANDLNVADIDDMPTCAVFGVHANCESWKDFKKAEKRFWFFDYPKQ